MWKLTLANVSWDAGVSSGPCQILTFSVRNVFTVRILVAFGQAKIDDVDIVFGSFCGTDKKVVRFNISMYNSFFMHFLKRGKT